ncbi:adenylate/guanylate cyclase domain-containing protein [Leptospira perolatii]|uniref:Adenylate/guanylate cyclase domain-containing protein n=1 Tax=Leptospira perolatii TaxID=2023191 RepID=A0A2M9ZND4_9LEPT|nr:adenylate/guanylate cyclase domain-containing protein [Leptospira perolatii]PJZ69599.1 adenylate/guanylate cyclase domain-containing protein [Leptospira perolatii]PJZ73586.1 adenylate/guanylate cyclase domain-containing protein [Leptospira perolatii]
MKRSYFAQRFRFLLLVPMFFLASYCGPNRLQSPVASNGILDLSSWDINSEPIVSLNGDWEYYPGILISSKESIPSGTEPSFSKVPRTWKGDGFGTYHLKVLLSKGSSELALASKSQATAYRLFLNGKELISAGTPGTVKDESIPSNHPAFRSLGDVGNELDIFVQVSNFHHRLGGIWFEINLGSARELQFQLSQKRDWDWFLGGIFFLTALFHIGEFLARRKDRSSFIFGAFCAILFLRLFITEDYLLPFYFPSLSYDACIRLDYFTFYLGLPLSLHYLKYLFPNYFPNIWLRGFYSLAAGFIISLLLPLPEATEVIPYYQAVFFVAFVLGMYVLVRAIGDKQAYSVPLCIGYFALGITGTVDVFSTHQMVRMNEMLPVGLLILVIIQTFVLSFRFSQLAKEKDELTEELRILNESYRRFVPIRFLGFLGKKKITELGPGDQALRDMSVLFSDIRSFTELSEKLDPKESFEFLNSYLSRMEPIIRSNHGFVDKYFGDAIMALFPENPDDALHAAVQMQISIQEENLIRAEKGIPEIQVGIGVHTGSMMMGLIGGEGKLESTVISDAVRVVSHLESMTRHTNSNILVSEEFFLRLKNPDAFLSRKLDQVKIKGRDEELVIYEIADFLGLQEREAFRKSKTPFEKGVLAFWSGRYKDAGESFREALRLYPGDLSSHSYIKRCSISTQSQASKALPPEFY